MNDSYEKVSPRKEQPNIINKANLNKIWIKISSTFKIFFIFILIILLLFPQSMIDDLVRERNYAYENVKKDISSKWSKEQILGNVFISFPIGQYKVNDNYYYNYQHLYPDELNIHVDSNHVTRQRGIYNVSVYNTEVILKGKFKGLKEEEFGSHLQFLDLDNVKLTTGINDVRGLEEVSIKWNNIPLPSGFESPPIIESQANSNLLSKKINQVFW